MRLCPKQFFIRKCIESLICLCYLMLNLSLLKLGNLWTCQTSAEKTVLDKRRNEDLFQPLNVKSREANQVLIINMHLYDKILLNMYIVLRLS